MVDGNTLTIELATKHLGGDWHAEHITGELTMSVEVVNTSGSFEDLDDGSFTGDFKDLTLSGLAVFQLDVDDLSELGELDVVKNNERTLDIEDCPVIDAWGDVVVSGGCGSIDCAGFYLSQ